MAVNKVDLYVSQIIEHLNNGLTWLKKDDLGYGSIEQLYGANEKQINAIRKHPALKDAETCLTVFNIIDDSNASNNKTKKSQDTGSNNSVEQPMVQVDGESAEVDTDAAAIFAQL